MNFAKKWEGWRREEEKRRNRVICMLLDDVRSQRIRKVRAG